MVCHLDAPFTEGHKVNMSKRISHSLHFSLFISQIHARTPPPHPLNFEILLEYFKYFYFNFYINPLLIKVLYFKKNFFLKKIEN
jgi:hypothetical protein